MLEKKTSNRNLNIFFVNKTENDIEIDLLFNKFVINKNFYLNIILLNGI